MLFCTFRYRTAAHLRFMEAAAAQLDVMPAGAGIAGQVRVSPYNLTDSTPSALRYTPRM